MCFTLVRLMFTFTPLPFYVLGRELSLNHFSQHFSVSQQKLEVEIAYMKRTKFSIACASSSPKQPNLFGKGCGKSHTEICDWCQLIPDVVRILTVCFQSGEMLKNNTRHFKTFFFTYLMTTLQKSKRNLISTCLHSFATKMPKFRKAFCSSPSFQKHIVFLQRFLSWIEEENNLPPLTIQMLRHNIEDSHLKIKELMSHTIRNQIQNNHWESMINEANPNRVFVTVSQLHHRELDQMEPRLKQAFIQGWPN